MSAELRKKIIIAADDFGKSHGANARIIALARAGKIDRVAVFPEKIIGSKEIKALLESGVKIDLHLDSGLPEARGGPFVRVFYFLAYYFSGKISSEKISVNWKGQLERFNSLFSRMPDGLNSHQHIHFFHPYFRIILELAARKNIPYLRFGRSGILDNSNLVSRILKILWLKDLDAFRKSGLDSSDFLASYDWNLSSGGLPEGKTELVFHPERDEEYEFMTEKF